MLAFERSFSDLLRNPKDVAAAADEGDVALRRRDGPDLWLTRADREAEKDAALAAAARALRHVAVAAPSLLREVLADVFAWTTLLPAADQRLFAEEFARVLAAASEFGNYAPLSQTIREWRATAEVHADPRLARRLRRPAAADGGPVSRP